MSTIKRKPVRTAAGTADNNVPTSNRDTALSKIDERERCRYLIGCVSQISHLEQTKINKYKRNLKKCQQVVNKERCRSQWTRKFLSEKAEAIVAAVNYMQTILRPTTPPDVQWLWVALDGHPIRLDFYTTCTEEILQLSVQYVAVIALAARQAVVCADVAMDMAEQVVQPVSVFAKLRLMMRKRTLQDLVHNMDSTLQATRAIHTEWDALRDIQIDSLEYSPMRLRESVRVHLENTEMLLVQTSHAAGSAANAEIPEEILLREARVLRTAMACVHEACTLVVIANNLRQAMGSAIVCSISGDFELFDKLSPPEVKPLDEKKIFLTRGGDGSVDNSFISRIDQIYRRCQVAEANAGAAVRSGMDLPVP